MADHISRYTGQLAEEGLRRILFIDEKQFAWTIMGADPTAPVDLNTVVTPGNYVIYHYTNGNPDYNIQPINMQVYQGAGGFFAQFVRFGATMFHRVISINPDTGNIVELSEEWSSQIDSDVVFIHRGETAPVNPEPNTLWLYVNSTTNEYILNIWNGTNWVPVIPEDSMHSSVYDPNGIKKPVDTYIDEIYTGSKTPGTDSFQKMLEHMKETDIHIDAAYRVKMNEALSTAQLDQFKLDMDKYVTDTINKYLADKKYDDANTKAEEIQTRYDTHIANNDASGLDHVTTEQVANWNSKSDANHAHNSDGKVEIDASKIVSGTLSIDRMPPEAFTRVYVVVDTASMMTHAANNHVPNGTVYHIPIEGNTIGKWYRLRDKTKVSSLTEGYLDFSTDPNGMVIDFDRIIMPNPNVVASFGTTDLYNKTDLDNKVNTDIKAIIEQQIIDKLPPYISDISMQLMDNYGGRGYSKGNLDLIDKNVYNYHEGAGLINRSRYIYSYDRLNQWTNGIGRLEEKLLVDSLEERLLQSGYYKESHQRVYRPFIATPKVNNRIGPSGKRKFRTHTAGDMVFFVHDVSCFEHVGNTTDFGYMYYLTVGEITPHYITFEELFSNLTENEKRMMGTDTDIRSLSISYICAKMRYDDNTRNKHLYFVVNMHALIYREVSNFELNCLSSAVGSIANIITIDSSIYTTNTWKDLAFIGMDNASYIGAELYVESEIEKKITRTPLFQISPNIIVNSDQTVTLDYVSMFIKSFDEEKPGLFENILHAQISYTDAQWRNFIQTMQQADRNGYSPLKLFKYGFSTEIFLYRWDGTFTLDNKIICGDTGRTLNITANGGYRIDYPFGDPFPFIYAYDAKMMDDFIVVYGTIIGTDKETPYTTYDVNATEKYSIALSKSGDERSRSLPYRTYDVLGVWNCDTEELTILPTNIYTLDHTIKSDQLYQRSFIVNSEGVAVSSGMTDKKGFDARNDTHYYNITEGFNATSEVKLFNFGEVFVNHREVDYRMIESMISGIYYFGKYHNRYLLIVGTGYKSQETGIYSSDIGDSLSSSCSDKIIFLESDGKSDWSVTKVMEKYDNDMLTGTSGSLEYARSAEPAIVVKDDIVYIYYEWMSDDCMDVRIVSLNTYQDRKLTNNDSLSIYHSLPNTPSVIQHRLAKHYTDDLYMYPVTFRNGALECKMSRDGINWTDKFYPLKGINIEEASDPQYYTESTIQTTRVIPRKISSSYTVNQPYIDPLTNTDETLILDATDTTDLHNNYGIFGDTFIVHDMVVFSENEILFDLRMEDRDMGVVESNYKHIFYHTLIYWKDGVVISKAIIPPMRSASTLRDQITNIELCPAYNPITKRYEDVVGLSIRITEINNDGSVIRDVPCYATYTRSTNTFNGIDHWLIGVPPVSDRAYIFGGKNLAYAGTVVAKIDNQMLTHSLYIELGYQFKPSERSTHHYSPSFSMNVIKNVHDAGYTPETIVSTIPCVFYPHGIFLTIYEAGFSITDVLLNAENKVKEKLGIASSTVLTATILDVKYRETFDRKLTLTNHDYVANTRPINSALEWEDVDPEYTTLQVALMVLVNSTDANNPVNTLYVIECGSTYTVHEYTTINNHMEFSQQTYYTNPHIIPIDPFNEDASNAVMKFWDYDFDTMNPIISSHRDLAILQTNSPASTQSLEARAITKTESLEERTSPNKMGNGMYLLHGDLYGQSMPSTIYTNYRNYHQMNYYYTEAGKTVPTDAFLTQDLMNYSAAPLPMYAMRNQVVAKDGYRVIGLNQIAIADTYRGQMNYIYRSMKSVHGTAKDLSNAEHYINLTKDVMTAEFDMEF